MEGVSEQYSGVEETDDPELSRRVEKTESILQALLQFCQRNSGRMDEKARQVSYSNMVAVCTVGCCTLCDDVLLASRQCGSPHLIRFTACRKNTNQPSIK